MMWAQILLVSGVSVATLATLTMPSSHFAIWNATASVPTGLYLVRGKDSLHLGERVAIAPPPSLQRLLAERRYLSAGIPLLKRVAAVPGQRVCRHGRSITIDGRYAGSARSRDRAGRTLPAWAGCRVLRSGELFVMNPAAPDSFDGRYFGALRHADVIGRATPVWTDEARAGAHVWFAEPRALDPPTNSSTGD